MSIFSSANESAYLPSERRRKKKEERRKKKEERNYNHLLFLF
jgi:hypothetical protein